MTKAIPNEPAAEPRSIFLRGYVVREKKARQGAFDPELAEVDRIPPSDCSLTFDCETTTDAAQSLRFGAYQFRQGGVIAKDGAGLFHAEDLDAADLEVLKAVAARDGLRLLTVRQFVDWVLYDRVYLLGGTVVGFNLPFDISRIALGHGSARSSMRGGFSFKLSRNTDWPRLRVKHISSKMAFIRYGAPPKKRTPAGQAKRGLKVPPKRGSFVDVKTLASALLSGSHSLLTLSRDVLQVPHPKLEVDEHGGPLTPEYVGYAVRDVQATWECYDALTGRLASYGLTTVEPKTLYSEASLGKAYLRQMGVRPWREMQPDFPPEMIGEILSTYYGGRAEVRIRRQKQQVVYCDFLSMYPTVCTLMGLWRFVIAKGMTWSDVTAETQARLDRLSPGDMLDQNAWSDLTILVQLKPSDDVLPVRTNYGDDTASNIGVNRLSSETPLWFTLADVIASKVLSGKTPIIERAVRFTPEGVQDGLKPIEIAGNPNFHVEPASSDFYRRVIDLRQTVKARMDDAAANEKAKLDSEQLALKILANATSYGIFIEMIVATLDKAETLKGYGADGHEFPVTTTKYEEPGAFFHPLLATLITGAARLMLALAEHRALDEGLDWVFCDTDSIAMAKPEGMAALEFIAASRRVCAAFTDLNPYAVKGKSILQVESQNFARGRKGDWESAPPLFCYAVSAKRYALYNEGAPGDGPIIRKASAHGLGHLLAPYQDPDKARGAARFEEIKVDLWQEDLWKRIIVAAENPGRTDGGAIIGLEDDPRLAKPVASRYAATKPELLSWFKLYNSRRPYSETVRPFGFLLSLQAGKLEQRVAIDPEAHEWWSKYRREPAVAAPYDRDASQAANGAFDRRMRHRSIPTQWLVDYAGALSDYHLQPESKFFGGERRLGTGPLQRRHVCATSVQQIGKEADRWEEQLHVGQDDGAISYGLTPKARADMIARVKWARRDISVRRFTKAAGMSDHTLAAVVAGMASDAMLVRANDVANTLLLGLEGLQAEERELLSWAFRQAAVEGQSKFAGRIGVDASNLAKALKRRGRSVSKATLDKLMAARASETAIV